MKILPCCVIFVNAKILFDRNIRIGVEFAPLERMIAMARFKDIAGMQFGRLKVVGLAGKSQSGKLLWKCLCDCGQEKTVMGTHLTGGKIRSCGCLHIERITTQKGHSKNPAYQLWVDMHRRCNDPSRKDYPSYGGRGIRVDPRWKDFEVFLSDVGRRPGKSELDRIDPEGNYEPGNVQWIRKNWQNSNKRNNHILEFNGESLPLIRWAQIFGIPESTIRDRLKRGWSVERALSAKPKGKESSHGNQK